MLNELSLGLFVFEDSFPRLTAGEAVHTTISVYHAYLCHPHIPISVVVAIRQLPNGINTALE